MSGATKELKDADRTDRHVERGWLADRKTEASLFKWVILALIALIIVFTPKDVWSAIANAIGIRNVFVSIVGGFVGAAVWTFLTRHHWRKDVADIHGSLRVMSDRLDGVVTGTSALVERLANDHSALHQASTNQFTDLVTAVSARLEQQHTKATDEFKRIAEEHASLHKALGGKYTASMFGYHPRTSKGVAGVIGNIVDRLYQQHWNKVAVVKAIDLYRIVQSEEIQLMGGREATVWVVDFVSYWVWRNDSNESQRPLKDFFVGVAPTIPVLRSQDDGFHETNYSVAYFNFLRERSNYIVSNIQDPINPERLVKDEDVGKIFEIHGLSFWLEGKGRAFAQPRNSSATEESMRRPADVPEYELIKIAEMEPKNGFHSAWDLPKALKEWELKEGAELKVAFEGRMRVEARSLSSGGYEGNLSYSPSDVVVEADGFQVLVGVPKTKNGRPRTQIDRMTLDSRLATRQVRGRPDDRPELPNEYRKEGYTYTSMKSEAALSELDLIEVYWSTRSDEGP